MAHNPLVSHPDTRALGLGVLCYVALGAVSGSLLPQVPSAMARILELIANGTALFHLMLGVLLMWPGIVVGIAAKRSQLMHGILLGVLTVGFMALLILVADVLGVRCHGAVLHQLFAALSVMVLIFSLLGAMVGNFIGDKLRGLCLVGNRER